MSVVIATTALPGATATEVLTVTAVRQNGAVYLHVGEFVASPELLAHQFVHLRTVTPMQALEEMSRDGWQVDPEHVVSPEDARWLCGWLADEVSTVPGYWGRSQR